MPTFLIFLEEELKFNRLVPKATLSYQYMIITQPPRQPFSPIHLKL